MITSKVIRTHTLVRELCPCLRIFRVRLRSVHYSTSLLRALVIPPIKNQLTKLHNGPNFKNRVRLAVKSGKIWQTRAFSKVAQQEKTGSMKNSATSTTYTSSSSIQPKIDSAQNIQLDQNEAEFSPVPKPRQLSCAKITSDLAGEEHVINDGTLLKKKERHSKAKTLKNEAFDEDKDFMKSLEAAINELRSHSDARLIVVLTARPSLAADILKVLNLRNTALTTSGYFGDLEYSPQNPTAIVVTWCDSDALVVTSENHSATKITLDDLPILPDRLTLKLANERKCKQVAVVCKLLQHADEIVCATDPSLEGELLFRDFYRLSKATAPFKRLWLTSCTEKDIKTGLKQLRDASEFDSLYQSAECRRFADWLVETNFTHLLSCKFGERLSASECPVGRIHTPLLRSIVERFIQQNEYTPETFCELLLTHKHFENDIVMKWFHSKGNSRTKKKPLSENDAVSIRNELAPHSVVVECKEKNEKEPPPLLYDLTTLQRDAFVQFCFTASKTLRILRSLYETYKLITYPQTNSCFLPPTLRPHLNKLLKMYLARPKHFALDNIATAFPKYFDRFLPIFKAIKITDHHAIIPTLNDEWHQIVGHLKRDEYRIFDLIVRRLLATILPAAEKKSIEVTAINNNKHYFVAQQTLTTVPGWKMLYSSTVATDQTPLHLKKWQTLDCILPPQIEIKKTLPPPLFTEASLLEIMQNPKKLFVTPDGELLGNRIGMESPEAEHNKESETFTGWGLGTPGHRTSTVDKLVDFGYVKRLNKNLMPTRKGIRLIKLLQDNAVADYEALIQLEERLYKINVHKEEPQLLMQDVKSSIAEQVDRIKKYEEHVIPIDLDFYHTNRANSAKLEPIFIVNVRCPKCGHTPLKEGPYGYFCSGASCNFYISKTLFNIPLPPEKLLTLIAEGTVTFEVEVEGRKQQKCFFLNHLFHVEQAFPNQK
jgi:DNA topoisomerase-3